MFNNTCVPQAPNGSCEAPVPGVDAVQVCRNVLTLVSCLQVDMVLSGHVHNYQRTCSVFKNTCVPPAPDGSSQAPVWIVNGNAGQWLSTAEPVIPPFFEAVAIEHGYLRYHVNRTMLFAEVKCFCSSNKAVCCWA